MYTRWGFTAFMFLAASSVSHAQGLGEFVGTVTDPSGGSIPSAKVTATEAGTGLSRTVLTNAQGYYVIPSLRPSTYDLTVEAAGFHTATQKNVTLGADQRATVNLNLEVGATTETVSVVAAAAQVDTTTATMSEVVNERRIIELPLNGRNAAQLTLLVPGAVNSPSGGADQGQTKTFPGAVTISANGSRQNQISYQLDGGNNVDEYTNVNAPFPFPDALQEFSVQTSNYNAEYGQNAGGVVNIITKSGTNDLHGDVFEFIRNARFNSRNFFAANRDQLKRNQFGGVIGGPLTIPGVYSGRDRTFFFAGYQGTRIRNITNNESSFVPTPANLAGDFSALLDAGNPANPLKRAITVVDPETKQPFPGNMIPVSRFDPASLNVTKMLPAAGGNGSVFYAKPIRQNFNEVIAKVDHSFSPSDRISGRYFMAKFFSEPIYSPENLLTYTVFASIMSQNALIHETHIFRPNLLNDFRFNYARENAGRAPAEGVPNMHDLGVQNIYQPPEKGIQSVNVSGFFSVGDSLPAWFTRNNFTLADDLRWVTGRHSLAFGFHGELSRVDIVNQFLAAGTFGFTADATNYAVASFLLGKLRTFRQGAGEFKNNRNKFLGFYAQDSFRATSQLTLNFGVRYEPYFPWREVRGRVAQFRPDAYWRGETSTQFINAPPGLFFPGDAGVPENGTRPVYDNIAPRVGFAYDVLGNGKTSIRGGAGVFYDTRQNGIFNNRFVNVTPFSPQLTVTDPEGPFSNPLVGLTNPFPAQFPPPRDAAFPLPVLMITNDPTGEYKVPTIYNWNLAIERQVASNLLARVAYVGSHSSHLLVPLELNPAVYMPGSSLSTDARRVFKDYQFITEASQAANSTYNSLQLSLEKRFARGFTIHANYTWSKSLDNAAYQYNATGPSDGGSYAYPWYFENSNLLDRGPSDFDHAHRFVTSWVWQSPQLAASNAVLRAVAGGWQISGVMQAQSGGPLTILAGRDQSQTSIGRDRAVINGEALGPGACKNTAPCVDYLNTGSFVLPAIGEFGNIGKGSIRGPGLLNFDVGFFKNFPHRRTLARPVPRRVLQPLQPESI
ncbi:MAG: carboxypeptidase regulatory-like domain-containing protein [Bryobacteraceae bacterium]